MPEREFKAKVDTPPITIVHSSKALAQSLGRSRAVATDHGSKTICRRGPAIKARRRWPKPRYCPFGNVEREGQGGLLLIRLMIPIAQPCPAPSEVFVVALSPRTILALARISLSRIKLICAADDVVRNEISED